MIDLIFQFEVPILLDVILILRYNTIHDLHGGLNRTEWFVGNQLTMTVPDILYEYSLQKESRNFDAAVAYHSIH